MAPAVAAPAPLPSALAKPDACPLVLVGQISGIVGGLATNRPRSPHHVRVDKLNVRRGPGTGFAIVGHLSKFEMVDVLREAATGGWLLVRTPGGFLGFVAKRYLVPGVGPGIRR